MKNEESSEIAFVVEGERGTVKSTSFLPLRSIGGGEFSFSFFRFFFS